MNDAQKICARSYADGEFAALVDAPDWRERLPSLGDGLFAYLMVELSDDTDCKTVDEAVDRVETSIAQLMRLSEVLGRFPG